jgi:hypothetical protein
MVHVFGASGGMPAGHQLASASISRPTSQRKKALPEGPEQERIFYSIFAFSIDPLINGDDWLLLK